MSITKIVFKIVMCWRRWFHNVDMICYRLMKFVFCFWHHFDKWITNMFSHIFVKFIIERKIEFANVTMFNNDEHVDEIDDDDVILRFFWNVFVIKQNVVVIILFIVVIILVVMIFFCCRYLEILCRFFVCFFNVKNLNWFFFIILSSLLSLIRDIEREFEIWRVWLTIVLIDKFSNDLLRLTNVRQNRLLTLIVWVFLSLIVNTIVLKLLLKLLKILLIRNILLINKIRKLCWDKNWLKIKSQKRLKLIKLIIFTLSIIVVNNNCIKHVALTFDFFIFWQIEIETNDLKFFMSSD